MKLKFFLHCIAVTLITAVAPAQTSTTFTYQGELQESGSPANGVFNIDFSLWDAVTGGNQIGTTDTNLGVPVVDGKFTVELDFSASSFDNSNRWLEITVNGTSLSPRNLITRSPYAIQTRGIVVDYLNNVGIGTVNPLSRLHIAGYEPTLRISDDQDSGELWLQDVGPTQARIRKSNSNGSVLLDIDPIPNDGSSAASIRFFRSTNTTGVKQVVFYNGNNTTATSAAIGLDGIRSYFQAHGGNFGVGTTNPVARLHAESDTEGPFPVIYGHAVSPSSDSAAVLGEVESATGTGIRGFNGSPTGIGFGVRGASLSAAGFDFYADGAGQDYGSSSSRRWKSKIVAIDQPLEKISQLEGVYFDWDTAHGGHHDVGMIAEDVGKVLPEIVNYEENGSDANGMDYSRLTPLLVEAVKALRQEKDAEISQLKQQNNETRQLNDQMQQQTREMQQEIQDLKRLVEQLTLTESGAAK